MGIPLIIKICVYLRVTTWCIFCWGIIKHNLLLIKTLLWDGAVLLWILTQYASRVWIPPPHRMLVLLWRWSCWLKRGVTWHGFQLVTLHSYLNFQPIKIKTRQLKLSRNWSPRKLHKRWIRAILEQHPPYLGQSGIVPSKILQRWVSTNAGHGSPPTPGLFRLRCLLLKPGDWSDIRQVFEQGLHVDQSDTLQSLGITHDRKLAGLLSWSQRLEGNIQSFIPRTWRQNCCV